MGGWITLHDSEWTPETITAEIENRAQKREAESGSLNISVPPFAYQKRTPQLFQDHPLQNHLRILAEAPSLKVTSAPLDNIPKRIPLFDSILLKLREQITGLALFYINRTARKQNRINEELAVTLNELTRFLGNTVESQQKPLRTSADDLAGHKEPGKES
jgi:hypothetical protein